MKLVTTRAADRIRLYFPSWIWIRIQYTGTDPDPGGKFLRKNKKHARKLVEIDILTFFIK